MDRKFPTPATPLPGAKYDPNGFTDLVRAADEIGQRLANLWDFIEIFEKESITLPDGRRRAFLTAQEGQLPTTSNRKWGLIESGDSSATHLLVPGRIYGSNRSYAISGTPFKFTPKANYTLYLETGNITGASWEVKFSPTGDVDDVYEFSSDSLKKYRRYLINFFEEDPGFGVQFGEKIWGRWEVADADLFVQYLTVTSSSLAISAIELTIL